MIAHVVVGWTSTRPVLPDEHLSGVIVDGVDAVECQLVAAQMVACRDECQMPTSTMILEILCK